MIIYHTAPIRCFPLLVEKMAPEFRNPYHFRMPIKARNLSDHRVGMLNHVVAYNYELSELPRRSRPRNGFPYDVSRNGIDFVAPTLLEDIDFLYGVFDGNLIKKRDGDFVFTILSDPVRHIYDLFDYLSFASSTYVGKARVIEGVALYDEIVAAGLHRFVDRFLAGDREILVAGRSFYLIEDSFRFNFNVDYDFIGTEERIEDTVAILSSQLGIPIVPSERLLSRRSSIASGSRYRYDDLCRSLISELAKYESVRTL
ncbi:MAG TPA: hypothetical protein VHC97_02545 [Thermoanaerobaculia bacterium]|nr:hypothetical protein [Thermoanaerobaculia bacterium]